MTAETDNAQPVVVKRQRGFQKGQSGNPNGRPKNSKNQMTLMKQALEWELRKQISLDVGKVMAKAIEMALDGNEAMIKLIIDKVVPSVRASEDSEVQRERIQIVINKLPGAEPVAIQGKTLNVD
jgi:hypothetical protein